MKTIPQMLKPPATVEGMTAIHADAFLVRFDFTHNAMGVQPLLARMEVEKLRALCSEALSSTQSSVTDPAMLARVVPRI